MLRGTARSSVKPQRRSLGPGVSDLLRPSAALLICGALAALGCEGQPSSTPEATQVSTPSWALSESELQSLDPRFAERLRAAQRRAANDPSGATFGELGRTYHAHNYFERARRCYAEASRLDSSAAEWPYYLGLLAAERGEVETAVEFLERARTLGDRRPVLLDRLARAHLAHGEPDRARELFLEIDEELPARSALGLGRLALEAGELEQALIHLRRAARAEPDDRVTTYLLGTTLRRMGRATEANQILSRVESLEEVRPRDALIERLYAYRADLESLLQRGSALLERGDVGAAEELYREILGLDPQHADALFNLGVLLGRTERFSEAEEVLTRAVEAAPERTDTRLMLAMSFASQGRIDEARTALERLLEIDPGNERALQLLASRPE